MKRLILIAAVCVCAFAAFADSVTVTVTCPTNGTTTYSSAINASGWVDRIEIVKSLDAAGANIDIATFSGTTAMNSFVDINALASATDTVVIRPRVLGTGLSGTALAAVTGTAVGTNTTTMLVAQYERMMIGGNTLLSVSGTNATVTATIYYERLAR